MYEHMSAKVQVYGISSVEVMAVAIEVICMEPNPHSWWSNKDYTV